MAISLAQFRLAYKGSPVPTMISRLADGVILDVNTSFQELTGYANHELIGKTANGLALWADELRVRISHELRGHGAMINVASTLRTKQGARRNTLTSLQIIDLDGIPCVLRTDYDITERKRAEDDLRASEEKFRSLVSSLHDRVLIVDRDMRQLEVYGQSSHPEDNRKDRFIGKTPREMVGTENALVHEQAGHEALKGEPVTYEWSWTFPNGTVEWYQTKLSPMKDGAGQVTGMVSVSHDVTGLKLAAAAARESEARFRSLVDSMEDLVMVLDTDLVITAVHGAWPIAQKLDPGRMVGRTTRAVFGINEAPIHEEACRRALGGENRIYEMSLVMPTGTRHLQVSVSPLRNSAGRVTGLVLVGRDITTVKRAEMELHQRDERLQEMERVESLGRLAGGVAHDFNNLLTIINGYCELLLENTSLTPDDTRKIQEIAKAGGRAAALTGQLLAFGRRQVLQPRVIDLNETVQEMTTMLRRLIGEDIVLTTKLDDSLGKVQADPGQLGQVIMNLAVNARDAMPAGGRLFVETANIDVSEEYARWHTELHPGPYIQLTVSDTGSGMDRATQARVFEPFFTTKEKGKGTGLGLSTAYGIVRQSGGEILLYSEPGRGTTFKIFLPRVPSAAADAAPASLPVSTDLRGHETILVAEDEAVIRMLARQVLESQGYTVLEAEDGLQALALIQKHADTIDLLVTDVVMPRLGGTELVRHLRDLGMETKVLYMSGYTGMLFEELGKSDPGSRFLQKPFQPAMLLHLARELLGPPVARA